MGPGVISGGVVVVDIVVVVVDVVVVVVVVYEVVVVGLGVVEVLIISISIGISADISGEAIDSTSSFAFDSPVPVGVFFVKGF